MNWLHSICLTRMDCRSACCSAWAITVASLGPSSWRPGDVPELVPVEGGGALREVKLARLAGEGVVQVADLAGVVAADLDERKEVLIGGVEAGEDLVRVTLTVVDPSMRPLTSMRSSWPLASMERMSKPGLECGIASAHRPS